MLRDSKLNRALIRVSVFLLRAITPTCIIYIGGRILGLRPRVESVSASVLLGVVDGYCTAEVLFYFLVFVPRKWWLNRPALTRNPLPTPEDRRIVLEKTWSAALDPQEYLSGWFKWVDIATIHREDIKDWLYWRLWNDPERDAAAEAELEDYLTITQDAVGIVFPAGRGPHKSMAVTFEPVRMQHRPLFYYCFLIGGADLQFTLLMWIYGYRFHSLPPSRILSSFPLRPFSLLTRHRSPAQHLSYWHREHTSPDHLPILFIHGIGVGLHYYLSFFHDFLSASRSPPLSSSSSSPSTPQIGLIALELLPISARLTSPLPSPQTLIPEILSILHHHSWPCCVLLTHSYGSIIAAHLLHHNAALAAPKIAPRIFLVDPVAFSFHDPHVPWNFLRRDQPRTASEIQLRYFASMDPGVAHALTRGFGSWVENSLWREDFVVEGDEEERGEEGRGGGGRRCTVALAGRDIITETEGLGRYLIGRIGRGDEEEGGEEWKEREWTGQKGLEVMWFDDCNHAEEFDTQGDRARLIEVLLRYSESGAKEIIGGGGGSGSGSGVAVVVEDGYGDVVANGQRRGRGRGKRERTRGEEGGAEEEMRPLLSDADGGGY